MNLLILQPTMRAFEYSLFSWDLQELILDEKLGGFGGMDRTRDEWTGCLNQINKHCLEAIPGCSIEAILVRVPFGGNMFAGPVVVDSQVVQELKAVIPQAPLHVPGILQLIDCCDQAFHESPVILVFETSFFVNLPPRERVYGISPQLAGIMNLRRYGYHGIYHESACQMVSPRLRSIKPEHMPARIISICLERRPEVAAVKGHRVLMVTGGNTPLEGIPGETSCGEIDPSIVLTLSEKMGWGPEKINDVLTHDSGLSGIVGQMVTLEEVLTNDKPAYNQARQIMQYRLLNACGAAMATMGGVDAIVFSGRYSKLANTLGPYLQKKLLTSLLPGANCISCYSLREPRATYIVNLAARTLISYWQAINKNQAVARFSYA